jgi:hypothetical protein
MLTRYRIIMEETGGMESPNEFFGFAIVGSERCVGNFGFCARKKKWRVQNSILCPQKLSVKRALCAKFWILWPKKKRTNKLL